MAASSADVRSRVRLRMEGPRREVGHDRVLRPEVALDGG